MKMPAPFMSVLSCALFAGIAGLLLPAEVHATGGLSCEVDDQNMSLNVAAGFSYGGNGRLFGVIGDVSVKSASLPKELGRRSIDRNMLVQEWFHDKDLRLMLYAETTGQEPFASVTITIITVQLADELSYEGSYALEMQLPEPKADGTANIVKKTGKINCGAG